MPKSATCNEGMQDQLPELAYALIAVCLSTCMVSLWRSAASLTGSCLKVAETVDDEVVWLQLHFALSQTEAIGLHRSG